jgi:hypothetical protein
MRLLPFDGKLVQVKLVVLPLSFHSLAVHREEKECLF